MNLNEVTIQPPKKIIESSLHHLLDQVLQAKNNGAKKVRIRFQNIEFINSVGLLTLCCITHFLNENDISLAFAYNPNMDNAVLRRLDDSGFSEKFLGKRIYDRNPTVFDTYKNGRKLGINQVNNRNVSSFIHGTLSPWVARRMSVDESEIHLLTTAFSEIAHNICDHSGMPHGFGSGYCFADEDSFDGILQVVFADFGVGIPNNIRTLGDFDKDYLAIKEALRNGVSTKSTKRNLGYGLHSLVKIIHGLHGELMIYSYGGIVRSIKDGDNSYVVGEDANGIFPGTLIKINIDINSFQEANDRLLKFQLDD